MTWEAFGSQTRLPRGLSRICSRSPAGVRISLWIKDIYLLCVVLGSPNECVRVNVCSQV